MQVGWAQASRTPDGCVGMLTLAVVAVVGAIVAWLLDNYRVNSARLNLPTSFDFLDQPSSFPIRFEKVVRFNRTRAFAATAEDSSLPHLRPTPRTVASVRRSERASARMSRRTSRQIPEPPPPARALPREALPLAPAIA